MRLVALTAVVVWVLTVRVGADMLWRAVFHWVPGAAALRVIVRYQVFMTAPVVAVAVWYLARLKMGPAAVAMLAVLLVAEEVTLAPPVALDRQVEMARLYDVPPPPPSCRSFYVSAARPGEGAGELAAIYSHNVDAMLVAQRFHVPTLNGFSTFQPPDWAFTHPERADYGARVQRYVLAHGLADVCGLDLGTLQWDVRPFG